MELWKRLRNANKKIVLYGMGNGAEKILVLCEKHGISISAIAASNEFVRGQDFRGYKVKSFDEVKSEYGDFIILTGFATRENAVIKRIYSLSEQYELYVPDVPVYGENIFNAEFYNKNITKIKETYNLLADDKSKNVYENIIQFKLTGELKYLKNIRCGGNCDTPKKEAFELLGIGYDEIYVDAGAYAGDSIDELIEYTKSISKIYAFEPDTKNYNKLEKYIKSANLTNKAKTFNSGLWSREGVLYFSSEASRNSSFSNNEKSISVKTHRLDGIADIANTGITYIKYDVEGAEREALDGSIKTIRRFAPKLCVSLYHRSEDIFDLPLLVKKIYPDYKFYIRKHKYIPSWDINLYCKR